MVSVLLATMGRPEKARACVQSIKDTTENVEIVVALDGPGAETLREMGCVVDHCRRTARIIESMERRARALHRRPCGPCRR
jgi:glycosyltransferase involved in cell wall biosynthesis